MCSFSYLVYFIEDRGLKIEITRTHTIGTFLVGGTPAIRTRADTGDWHLLCAPTERSKQTLTHQQLLYLNSDLANTRTTQRCS